MCRIVSNDNLNGVTIVPNRFIDEYMVDADDSQLKVYLYLLRFLYTPGVDIAFEAIADALDLTKGKVKKALNYWQEQGLLRYSEDKGNIDRIYMEPVANIGIKSSATEEVSVKEEVKEAENDSETAEAAETETKDDVKPVKADVEEFKPCKKIDVYLPENYTDKQLNLLALDEQFKAVMDNVEEKYYFPLQMRHDDLVALAGVYESIGFSEEMIDYLYAYCHERKNENMSNKAFTNFVRKVAVSWAERGIKTPEDQKVSEAQTGKLYTEIIKVLGLRRENLPKSQNEEINKWIYEYQLPGDVILTACNKAIDAEVDKPFGYTKKIIEDWHDNEVKTIDDVEKLGKKHKESTEKEKKSRKQPYNSFTDYDFKKMSSKENDELVAKLLKKNEKSTAKGSIEERLAGSKK